MSPNIAADFEQDELQLLKDASQFLSSPLPQTLVSTHPNQVSSPNFVVPAEWSSWWTWAGGPDTRSRRELASRTYDGNVEDADYEPRWTLLLRYYLDVDYTAGDSGRQDASLHSDYASIPQELRTFLDNVRRLQLSRQPGLARPVGFDGLSVAHSSVRNGLRNPDNSQNILAGADAERDWAHGMSPKKAHEVRHMIQYTEALLKSSPELQRVKHVVDVGAGQGNADYPLQAYLSRKLRDDLALHVLALDFNTVQSKGAARRDLARKRKPNKNMSHDAVPRQDIPLRDLLNQAATSRTCNTLSGSMTYETVMITESSLLGATDSWMLRNNVVQEPLHTGADADERVTNPPSTQTPILFVALHACGSLTPIIFRAVISSLNNSDGERSWHPQGAIVAGCCYNLINSSDYPLSQYVFTQCESLPLTANHLQLAAQVPAHWLDSREKQQAAALSIRKVIWRAILEGILAQRSYPPADLHIAESETDNARQKGRLGRLNDAVYDEWSTFLAHAGQRLGLDLQDGGCLDGQPELERRLQVLHVLRCLLGPVIESLILLDRVQWLREELKDSEMEVRLENLFDQASGSGRNVAIIVVPACRSAARQT